MNENINNLKIAIWFLLIVDSFMIFLIIKLYYQTFIKNQNIKS